jgi:hypothetical protein
MNHTQLVDYIPITDRIANKTRKQRTNEKKKKKIHKKKSIFLFGQLTGVQRNKGGKGKENGSGKHLCKSHMLAHLDSRCRAQALTVCLDWLVIGKGKKTLSAGSHRVRKPVSRRCRADDNQQTMCHCESSTPASRRSLEKANNRPIFRFSHRGSVHKTKNETKKNSKLFLKWKLILLLRLRFVDLLQCAFD